MFTVSDFLEHERRIKMKTVEQIIENKSIRYLDQSADNHGCRTFYIDGTKTPELFDDSDYRIVEHIGFAGENPIFSINLVERQDGVVTKTKFETLDSALMAL
jgi:hypothetical protein